MKLYFIRHGQSEANLLNEVSNRGTKHPLTALGREQVLAVARSLKVESISRIYASPLLRAVQTAEILSRELRVHCEITDALREYDCGIIEGKSDPASWQEHARISDAWLLHKRWDERIKDGESFNDIRRRFCPFIDELLRAHGSSDARFVLVGHGGTYRCMLPIALSNVDFSLAIARGFDHTEAVVAQTTASGLTCVKWGSTPLPAK
jgi:broad specificity phosphatase PhoE